MSSGNNRGAPRGQSRAAQMANAQAAAGLGAAGLGAGNPGQLGARLKDLIDKLDANKQPIIEFITQSEPAFIAAIQQKIQDIKTILERSNNDDAEFARRISTLRDTSSRTQTEISNLQRQLADNQTELQRTQAEITRLQTENQQGRDANAALQQAKDALEQQNSTNLAIISDIDNSLNRFDGIIQEIQGLSQNIAGKDGIYRQVNQNLDALSGLVTAKLQAYQNIMGQLPQQGGRKTRRHRKRMYGGYTYDSQGYQGAQVVEVLPSRRSSTRKRSNSSRSRRSRRH